ncbi:hypothetical protein BGZ94_009685, partial [Podila epigama]
MLIRTASTVMQALTAIAGAAFLLASFSVPTVELFTVALAPISTLLDKWTWEQLRAMTLGGNAAAREYFNKYPTADNKDAKTKYSSKIGITYKEKLAQRVKEDMIAHPGRSGLDHHVADDKKTPGTPASTADDDDFFNTWNQPKKSPTSSSSSPLTSGPPVVGLGTSTHTSTSRVSTARPVKSTLTAARKTGTASKPMKLGVKKTGTISFEEAEARAKAEAERIEKLGFEAAEEERLQKLAAEKAKAEAEAFKSSPSTASSSRTNYYQSNMVNPANKSDRVSSEDMERLGMGMGRMGFGSTPASSSKPNNGARFGGMGGGYTPQVEENVTAAREKFGNQKAISSDQYFGRNNYDADAQAEASSRLKTFSGATSISSNQYFGRPEDSPTLGSDVSLPSLINLSGSELAKKLGSADLETLKNAVQTGAGKRLPLFEQQTGYKVEIVFRGSHPELNEFLAKSFKGYNKDDISTSTPPELDLVSTHIKYAPSQVHFLQELDDHQFTASERAEFLEAALEACKVHGKLFQLPRMVDSRVLFYRSDIWDQLGLETPSTWQDLFECALRIHKAVLPIHPSFDALATTTTRTLTTTTATGTAEPSVPHKHFVHGYVFPGKLSGLFGTFYELATMQSLDTEALFDRHGHPMFDERVVVKVLKNLRRLVQGGGVPQEIDTLYFDEVSAMFSEGRVAMVADWPSYYGSMKKAFQRAQAVGDVEHPPRIGVMRYPFGANGKRSAYSGMHSFAIPTTRQDPEASLALLKFLVGDEQQWLEASESGSFPTKKRVLERLVEENERRRQLDKEDIEAQLDCERLVCLRQTIESDMAMFPHMSRYPELEDALYPLVQDAMMGRLSPEVAARKMRETAQK